jgi:hypothetical protein
MLGMVLFIAVGGGVVMLLWNWLLPALFGWRQVTFWQALGILVLSRVLFGGLGHHGFSRSMRRSTADGMADRMAERMQSMTPEERERFRQRMSERLGFGPSAGASGGQSRL